jgi:uncharacterized protein (DUF1778 family)
MGSDDQQRRSRSGSENRQRQALVAARVDPAERRLIQEAAKREGVPIGKFIRRAVLAAAERV